MHLIIRGHRVTQTSKCPKVQTHVRDSSGRDSSLSRVAVGPSELGSEIKVLFKWVILINRWPFPPPWTNQGI